LSIHTIGTDSYGIYLFSDNANRPANNSFNNIDINATGADDVVVTVGSSDVYNHLLNVTFNQTNVTFVGPNSGQLNVSWYTRGFVDATNQTLVQNANVILNSTSGSRWNASTDVNGYTPWFTTQGYIQNNSGIFSSNNYTVNVTHPSFTAYQSQQNVTESMTINVTMQTIPDTSIPVVTAILPVNTTYYVTNSVMISANVTDDFLANVTANITYPNGTVQLLPLYLTTGTTKYNASFTIPSNYGVYNITILANDTSSNLNNTERTNFTALSLPPSLNNITHAPPVQGFGQPVRINANVTDEDNVSVVWVGITTPLGVITNYTMTNISSTIWEYNYTNYLNGTYNYTIFANDTYNVINNSAQFSFAMMVNLTVQVKTLKDNYTDNEQINLTDPPDFSSFGNLGVLDVSDVVRSEPIPVMILEEPLVVQETTTIDWFELLRLIVV